MIVGDPRTTVPQAGDSAGVARRVDGRVVRGTRAGTSPVANQWVVVHRVGTDRSGPIDSTRTNAAGDFSIHYKTSGDTAAIYFASTSYGGVAYFTTPFKRRVVNGDDARITVFDTTSGPVPILVGGRHLIIGLAGPNGRRSVGDVYDLKNDSTVTRVARDTLTPVFSVRLPAQATAVQLNPSGDIGAGAVAQRGSTIQLFAPISPGIRQFAFTYELPANAFPLSMATERPEGVFELLVQEPNARIKSSGVALREMAPVSPDGRVFRRFLAEDVPAGSLVQIDAPRVVGAAREQVYVAVGIILLVAMAASLFVAMRRNAPRLRFAGAPAREPSVADRLVKRIAALDESFERVVSPDDAVRAEYQSSRAALKAELAEAIAPRRRDV